MPLTTAHRTIPNESLDSLSNNDKVNQTVVYPKNDLEVAFSVSEVQILHENVETEECPKTLMQQIGEKTVAENISLNEGQKPKIE